MEEKPRSISTHSLYYGLMTGAAMIVFSLILFIANLYMNRPLGFISLVILLGGMVWGTLEYRKTYLNGFMSYGNAFLTCFMIGLFAAILSTIYMFIFTEFIYPGFSQEILDQAVQKMNESGRNLSDEQMEQALKYTKMFTSPVMMTVWGLITNLFFSVVLALIAGIFLKKEDQSLNTF